MCTGSAVGPHAVRRVIPFVVFHLVRCLLPFVSCCLQCVQVIARASAVIVGGLDYPTVAFRKGEQHSLTEPHARHLRLRV